METHERGKGPRKECHGDEAQGRTGNPAATVGGVGLVQVEGTAGGRQGTWEQENAEEPGRGQQGAEEISLQGLCQVSPLPGKSS